MSSEMTVYKVEDIALEMGDAPFGSHLKNVDYTESGALVVQGKNIQGRSFDWSDKRHVSFEKWESIPRSHCFSGDLIFPKVGTIGKVGILSHCKGYDKYLLSTNTMKLKVNPEIANQLFVYYFFTWNRTGSLIKAMNSKSVQPVFNYTTLKNFPIELPSLDSQNYIANILGTLDDKIDLNHRMNATLETIAQAIFNAWFVDFDPVRAKMADRQPFGMDADTAALFPDRLEDSGTELGMIPEGWEVGVLSQIASLKMQSILPSSYPAKIWEHYSIPAYDEGKNPIHEPGESIKSGKYVVPEQSVLASKLNPQFQRVWLPDIQDSKSAICSTEFMPFVPNVKGWRPYLYEMLQSHPLQSEILNRATGSTGSRQRVKPREIAVIPCIIPPKALIDSFCVKASSLHGQQLSNARQNGTLATLRDTLLPRLMSGELRVS